MGTKIAASRLTVDGARFIGVETMPVEKWFDIPDNPIQRNTEERAKRARHLHKLTPSHYTVALAKYKGNGKREKVDGHTRGYIWLNTLTDALDNGEDGAEYTWENPKTGHNGIVTPLNTKTHDGMHCRDVDIRNFAGNFSGRAIHLMCRKDGDWMAVIQ